MTHNGMCQVYQQGDSVIHIYLFSFRLFSQISSVQFSRSVAQSCLTLCDPMDCSPSGPSVHGFLQARILGWVAMPSSRGSFQPRD